MLRVGNLTGRAVSTFELTASDDDFALDDGAALDGNGAALDDGAALNGNGALLALLLLPTGDAFVGAAVRGGGALVGGAALRAGGALVDGTGGAALVGAVAAATIGDSLVIDARLESSSACLAAF